MKRQLYDERESEFNDPERVRMLQQASEDFPSKIGLFKRCFRGEASPRAAIKAQCVVCLWGDHDGIRECKAPACPLWMYRPFVNRKTEKSAGT